MDAEQGPLRARHDGAHARRQSCRAPTSSSAFGRRACSSRRWSRRWPSKPLILALANPEPGDHARSRPRPCAPTRSSPPGRSDYPEPGQQRAVLPVHLPRRARCRRDDDQRGDEARAVSRASPSSRRPSSPTSSPRPTTGEELAFGPEYLIPKPFDPRLIVKIAPAVAKAAMEAGVATRPIEDLDAYRRPARTVRLSLGPADEADLRGCQAAAEAHRLSPKARTSACCARCRSSSTKARAADPHWPPRSDRRAHQALRPAHDRGPSTSRSSTPSSDERYRDFWRSITASRGARASRPTMRRSRCAGADDADRRDAAAAGRRRRHDVRHVRAAYAMHLRLHRERDRAAPGVSIFAAMNGLMLPRRTLFICDTYVNEDPTRGAIGRDDHAGRRGDAALRHDAQGRAAVAFELRHRAFSLGAEDAPSAGSDSEPRARSRSGGRDAWRRGAVGGDAATACIPTHG